MERNEFLKLLGTAGLAVCAGCSLESCSSSDPAPSSSTKPPTGVDFTLDLSSGANAALLTDGGFVYSNGIIIVCLNSVTSTYTAVSQACTHQGTTIAFQLAQNKFVCPAHGSQFSPAGVVLQGPATASLRAYNTSLTGTMLRVFS